MEAGRRGMEMRTRLETDTLGCVPPANLTTRICGGLSVALIFIDCHTSHLRSVVCGMVLDRFHLHHYGIVIITTVNIPICVLFFL